MMVNGKSIDGTKARAELKSNQAKLQDALKTNASQIVIANLHNEITQSFSSRAMAVRLVTTNKGKNTAGIDKTIWTSDSSKSKVIEKLSKIKGSTYRAKPLKRVGIAKSDGITKRPLSIPTMMDRTVQTLWNFVLDVHQEHTANARSFGFRKGRNAHQAINYAGKLCSGAGKRGILKVDISKAYDKINQQWLIENIPINKCVLRQGLNTGVSENGKGTPTDEGVPQGGPISPTIFNYALNGIETKIIETNEAFPIRYADDIAVFTKTKVMAEKAKESILEFLKPLGLTLNERKTTIAEIDEGVDLLGFNIREYPDITRTYNPRQPTKRGIVIVKPSMKSIENFRLNVKTILKALAKSKPGILIQKLNPYIRGGANYYKHCSGGTKTKNILGNYLGFKLKKGVYKKHSGTNVGRRQLLRKYFKGIQRRKTYYNKGTFFGQQGNATTLLVDIQEILRATEGTLKFEPSPNPYNPDDYNVIDKRIKKEIKRNERLSKLKQQLVRSQDGLCPLCSGIISGSEDELQIDHIIPRAEGGTDEKKNLALVHKLCHQKKTTWERKHRANLRKVNKSE